MKFDEIYQILPKADDERDARAAQVEMLREALEKIARISYVETLETPSEHQLYGVRNTAIAALVATEPVE